VIFADGDNLCPIDGVKEMIAKLKNVETQGLHADHFEPYMKYFDQVSKWEVDFFGKHLKKET